MELYDAILKRRTVRDFQEKSIDLEAVKRIVDAGLRAPSNNHLRQWEFILVVERSVRLALISKIKNNRTARDSEQILDSWGYTDPFQRQMYIDAIPKQYRMLLEAGCLIIPCFYQETSLLEPKNLSSLNGFASIWCCIENILLAAVNEGIYGVTRIPADEEIEHIKETLHIPEEYAVACYLAMGYADVDHAPRIPQHVVKVEERLHFDRWGKRV